MLLHSFVPFLLSLYWILPGSLPLGAGRPASLGGCGGRRAARPHRHEPLRGPRVRPRARIGTTPTWYESDCRPCFRAVRFVCVHWFGFLVDAALPDLGGTWISARRTCRASGSPARRSRPRGKSRKTAQAGIWIHVLLWYTPKIESNQCEKSPRHRVQLIQGLLLNLQGLHLVTV